MPYAELHAHSNFSFLDGASHPEELAAEAVRLGLSALALTDHGGLYGAVRFAGAARALGLATVFGAELTLTSGSPAPARTGLPDPDGTHLVVLARDPVGYASLSRAIAEAHLAGGSKGTSLITLDDLASRHDGHWQILTGCRKGPLTTALTDEGPAAAARALDRLVDRFGRDRVAVELWDHGDPLDTARNDTLAIVATERHVTPVATNNVHYATPDRFPLATTLAAVRSGQALDELDGWLPPAPAACLRSQTEQGQRFARWPGAVERSGEIAAACAFDLRLVAPRLPDFPVPPGHDEQSWLAELVRRGGSDRYGPRGAERVPGAWRQIDHELDVIGALGFPGYFLTVWDIVQFCRREGIFYQGRGSAATSAVCYALGITNVDAVSLGLLFERFLSPARDGPPDIDVDIEAGRREEVIQYVYERYGRHHAAQVGSVITYRARSAIEDAARACGYPPGYSRSWARQVEGREHIGDLVGRRHEGAAKPGGEAGSGDGIPARVLEMARWLEGRPRPLGLHPGGMVICDRPVTAVCPVEWASADGRSVLQWDKDSCARAGLVKFDLLGLGMLQAVHNMVDLVERYHGVAIDLSKLPEDPKVYDMLSRADTVGVFQVESRAQMATLPRLRPTTFYDIVVAVALIRPGPIQGGSVHPYLRRRRGEEPVSYLHPLLAPCLEKTLGVPLFQEQLMRMAIDVAGFTPAEADELRQAMGAKRSRDRMARLRERFYSGMASHGIGGDAADGIWEKMAAFASFGFPESHAIAFAHLVYTSAWLKLRYPAAFYAGLLNAQPMGFWAPRTLVTDARRHGVEVRRCEVNASDVGATLEWDGRTASGSAQGTPALRLGLEPVRGIGRQIASRIVTERESSGQPYRDMGDLASRTLLERGQLEALARAGATASLDGGRRRDGLWAAGFMGGTRPGMLPGIMGRPSTPPLPGISRLETLVADLELTGTSVDSSPMAHLRRSLAERGVILASQLATRPSGSRVRVAGVVTHRQRPSTARGATFMNLEDETGLVNVVCSPGCWERYREVARHAPALLVSGRLESAYGAFSVVCERMEEGRLPVSQRSRDFA